MDLAINLTYVLSAGLFIYGLKMLSSPRTARVGNLVSAVGMLIAIVMTLLNRGILDFKWIVLGLGVGSLIGVFAARLVAMTAMPEMVAIFNGFGGMASLLVGWSVYHRAPEIELFLVISIVLSVFIGGMTFTGSLVAFGKLNGVIGSKRRGKPLCQGG